MDGYPVHILGYGVSWGNITVLLAFLIPAILHGIFGDKAD